MEIPDTPPSEKAKSTGTPNLGSPALGAPILGAPALGTPILGAPSACSVHYTNPRQPPTPNPNPHPENTDPIIAPTSATPNLGSPCIYSVTSAPEQALGAPREKVLGQEAPREKVPSDPKGWYRRLLPHRDEPGIVQFITYRLADSVPATLLEQIEAEIRDQPPNCMDAERRRRIEAMLDKGHGSAILRHSQAAQCVIENWHHFAGQRYDLIAWVVMPTHVHLMIRPLNGESLPQIVQSWKSYTGKRLKALFPHACVDGHIWLREYWDRFIRDEIHFYKAIQYIELNPVNAGLVKTPTDWPYCGVNLTSETPLGTPSACSIDPNPEQALGAPR